jgi:hypothetical protein
MPEDVMPVERGWQYTKTIKGFKGDIRKCVTVLAAGPKQVHIETETHYVNTGGLRHEYTKPSRADFQRWMRDQGYTRAR